MLFSPDSYPSWSFLAKHSLLGFGGLQQSLGHSDCAAFKPEKLWNLSDQMWHWYVCCWSYLVFCTLEVTATYAYSVKRGSCIFHFHGCFHSRTDYKSIQDYHVKHRKTIFPIVFRIFYVKRKSNCATLILENADLWQGLFSSRNAVCRQTSYFTKSI